MQCLDVGCIGTEAVFGHDELEVGMALSNLAMKRLAALRSQSFLAVPSCLTILWHQGNHSPLVRMDQRRTQHLVVIRDRPVAVDLVETGGAMHRLGGKILRPIEGQK